MFAIGRETTLKYFISLDPCRKERGRLSVKNNAA